ncbi:MAG: hypothetical protein IPM25_19520 [Chloracidobacterium sp.]|nr:hypothetical protein [Chloracidobacterium sp.]
MKGSKVKNKEIDELGEKLVKASRISADEAERVVEDAALYGRVLKRILAEQQIEPAIGGFGWQVPAACSALAVIAAGTILMLPEGEERARSEPITPPPATAAETAAVEPPVKPEPVAASVSIPAETRRAPKPRRKSAARRAEDKSVHTPVPEFFEIGFAGGLEEPAMEGRVVRVELPRSALFAMGVNVPLENGTGALTAELLVGPDGAPKAIRLVE